MDWMTTGDAAKKLGVSNIRIRQFIQGGRLTAQRFGHIWMVSSDAVDAFERQGPGRPPIDSPKAKRRTRKRDTTPKGKAKHGPAG